jgi:hypothetical protein
MIIDISVAKKKRQVAFVNNEANSLDLGVGSARSMFTYVIGFDRVEATGGLFHFVSASSCSVLIQARP